MAPSSSIALLCLVVSTFYSASGRRGAPSAMVPLVRSGVMPGTWRYTVKLAQFTKRCPRTAVTWLLQHSGYITTATTTMPTNGVVGLMRMGMVTLLRML